jgi:hypothetical protein
MRYSFDLLNDIFDWCVADAELMRLLGIKDIADLEEVNGKLRREYQTDDVISSEDTPFLSYYFMHAEKTKNNWCANKGDLYVDIYTHTMYDAGMIAKRFRQILCEHTEIMLNYEGQHFSGVTGIYKYRLIYNPLIDGK